MLHFAPLSGPPTFPGHARCAVTTDLRGEWREERVRGERRAERGERKEERGERREKVRTEERGEAARLQIDAMPHPLRLETARQAAAIIQRNASAHK